MLNMYEKKNLIKFLYVSCVKIIHSCTNNMIPNPSVTSEKELCHSTDNYKESKPLITKMHSHQHLKQRPHDAV